MRDPYIRWANYKPAAYVGIFFNNFLGIAHVPTHRRRQVRQTLFHDLDKVFWNYDSVDLTNRKEVLSLKNLLAGDCTW